ncbi:tight adherence protein B [Humibacillus xanthopallidus]|uniref:Tight adherence protein B n=1 Tax=Humibacillus xanthopallidus TaxID=412689 RepID=A0A543I1S9_9MICO|nr:tight adherence protein B [Humibacillus xanthopallidus]
MTSGVTRGLAGMLIAFASIVGVGILPAHAADDLTAGLSEVQADGQTVTGALTLRGQNVLEADPGSLKATIDGKEMPVSIQKAKHVVRGAMLVIDTSGSMGPSGMATVRAASETYLNTVPKDVLVGVVSFANTAGVDQAPTLDRRAVQDVVDGLVSNGDTALYAAMMAAVKALGPTGDRSIVLLSDGADTLAPNKNAARAQAIAALKKAQVRVDVVRFKSNDPDATAALRGFASANGGSVVSAYNSAAARAAFKASAKALDTQAQFEIQTPTELKGSHDIKISGVAGSLPFTASLVADLGAAPAAVPTPAPSPSPVVVAAAPSTPSSTPLWVPLLAACLIGVGLFLLAATTLAPSLETRRERRLAAIEKYVTQPRMRSRSESKPHQTAITEQLIGLGDRVMKERESTGRTMQLIDRADLPLRAGEWFLLRVLAVLVGGAIGGYFLSSSVLLGITFGVLVGLFLPPAVLRHLARRRSNAFEKQLPGALALVATSLASGFGLPQALDSIARDASEPISKEFSRALAETRIGTDLPDALERMADRMDSTAMLWAVMAIRIQREVGGNLADTLRTTVQTLREREQLAGQIRALSAEGRLSAYILIALPIFLFIFMVFVSNDYIRLLWSRPIGVITLIVSVVLMVIGWFWMRRVIRIEV